MGNKRLRIQKDLSILSIVSLHCLVILSLQLSSFIHVRLLLLNTK